MAPSTTTISSKAYFPSLTGLRALAAGMVFFFHYNPFKHALPSSPLQYELRLLVGQWGHGVNVFFLLSGFLITLNYGQSIELSWGWGKRYLQNRFARIYPIYFLLTLIAIGVWQFDTGWPGEFNLADKIALIFLNLTLTRAYFERFVFAGLDTAWSLTVEESFYLLAPFILWSLKNHPYKRLAAYGVRFLAIGVALVFLLGNRLPYHFMGSYQFMLNATFFGYALEFMAGIALAVWVQQHPALPRAKVPLTAVGGLGMMAFLLAVAHLPMAVPSEAIARPAVIAFTCLFFYGLLTEHTLFRRVLETKTFDLLGKSSYVFYLLHVSFFTNFLLAHGVENIALLVVANIIASIVLYKVVEHPMNLRLRAKRASKAQ